MKTSTGFPNPSRALLALSALLLPTLASAYVGPGAGLSLLTALWGIIAAIGLAVIFVIMWPIRRLRRQRKARAADESAHRVAAAPDDETPGRDGDESTRPADDDRRV